MIFCSPPFRELDLFLSVIQKNKNKRFKKSFSVEFGSNSKILFFSPGQGVISRDSKTECYLKKIYLYGCSSEDEYLQRLLELGVGPWRRIHGDGHTPVRVNTAQHTRALSRTHNACDRATPQSTLSLLAAAHWRLAEYICTPTTPRPASLPSSGPRPLPFLSQRRAASATTRPLASHSLWNGEVDVINVR